MKDISLNVFISITTILCVYFHEVNGKMVFVQICKSLYLLYKITGNAAAPLDSTMLLYSTMKDIRIIRTNHSKVKPYILVKNLTDGAALDFNYADKKICWTDHRLENIQCATFDGVEIKDKVIIIVKYV